MSRLTKTFVGLGGVLVILGLVIATRPAHFRIERSIEMAAPPSVPFALVNDFQQWSQWSPYDKLDPAMTKTYSGAVAGVGATYHWRGDEAGEGRMTVADSQPYERIVIDLEFTKPFAASNVATFEFVPTDAATRVTWRMEGQNGFFGKAIGLVMDMDALVGQDFHDGLVAMKAIAEQDQSVAVQPAGDAPLSQPTD